MRIATYNVNGINGRLANLLEWLQEAAPDIVCLQELKAPDEKFPAAAHPRRRLRRDLARAEKLERRRDPGARRRAGRDPPRPARRSRRHAQPLYRSGDRRHDRRMPLPAERQSRAGPEIRLQAALVRPAGGARAKPARDSGEPVVLAGDYNVMPTDLDVYAPERWVDDALFRPEVRDAYRRLVEQGWTDALRALHPGERIYTFWKYFRNAFARDAGLRIDHLLLSPPLAKPARCRRRRPRGARPRKRERSCARLDRTCGCKDRPTATGAAPEQGSKRLTLSPVQAGHEALAAGEITLAR